MRNYIYRIFLILLLLIVHNTVFQSFSIASIRPDLALILTMFVAFKYGSMEAQVTGFISGLGMDIFSIHLFGVNAFTKTIVGFFAGLFRKRIYSENAMVIIIYIFIGSFFNGIIFALSNLIFKTGAISFWNYIYGTLIIEMLYNCVIGVPLFFLFEKSDKAFRRE